MGGSVPTVIKEEKEKMISCWIKDIEEIDNQVEKISCYYNTNIRVNSRDNIRNYYRKQINGGNDDVNDKVTINNDILNINNGDEEYIEEKERKIVHEEEECNIKKGNEEINEEIETSMTTKLTTKLFITSNRDKRTML